MPSFPSPRAARLSWLFAAGLALAGCQETIDVRGFVPDDDSLARIQIGLQQKEDVRDLLGTPSTITPFGDETWLYISRRTSSRPFVDTTVLDQQVVAIVFDARGLVADVRKLDFADGKVVNHVARVTPAPGKELTFLEQLVGNVGRFNRGGGAYIPGLSDYSVIVRGSGAVFLGGPPLVKAATGEEVSVEELGGAEMHTSVSGTCDWPADNEDHAIALGREIVAQWDRPKKWEAQWQAPEPPLHDPTELYGIIPDDIKTSFDMREVIARIVDGSRFHEYKPNYGTTLVCGFAHIWGFKVGILANNGVLFNDSSIKGAHFIELCDQNNTPLVFLQNITGYMVGREYERRGITKDGAKMIMAQTCSKVPKFTVMCNGSFGAGNYGMCGRAFDGRFLFTWPNSQIGVMGGEQAAKTLAEVKINQIRRNGGDVDPQEIEALISQTRAAYQQQLSAYYSTSELWDDGLLDPVDTRNALGIAISVSLNAPIGEPGYGVFRF